MLLISVCPFLLVGFVQLVVAPKAIHSLSSLHLICRRTQQFTSPFFRISETTDVKNYHCVLSVVWMERDSGGSRVLNGKLTRYRLGRGNRREWEKEVQRAVVMRSAHGRGKKRFPGSKDTMEEELKVGARTRMVLPVFCPLPLSSVPWAVADQRVSENQPSFSNYKRISLLL